MLPIIAIVGRPNVGKSTLFNRLTKSRQALVADTPGVTRDRLYGEGEVEGNAFIVIDTAGLGDAEEKIDELVVKQSWAAIREADAVLFVTDGRAGVTPKDHQLVTDLRKAAKTVYLVVNKTEGLDSELATSEFYQLGLGEPYPISSAHGTGVSELIHTVFKNFPKKEVSDVNPDIENGIQVAIIGKPNVGKSTLINRMLGEERVIVYDMPGTTRDSIYIPFERQGQKYTLIDTAGVRRRSKIDDAIEKFSVIKSLQAITVAQVVIMVIDGSEGLTDQDMRLLGFILEAGKALIIAINKWDGLTPYQRERNKEELDRRLAFVDFAKIYFISALHGTSVGDLFPAIQQAYESATCKLTTHELTTILQAAVYAHQPPAIHGRMIKLRYAHPGGHNPPVIVIHGKQTQHLPNSYLRYLGNFFRDKLKLVGTPVKIAVKSDNNPYDK